MASRRLIATLDLIASIDPEGEHRKARRTRKRHLQAFGPLRDVQVQFMAIGKMLPTFPELHGFYAYLMRRERKLVQGVRLAVKGVKGGKIQQAIRMTAKRVEALLDTPAKLQGKRRDALHAVGTAFSQVVERHLAIDPTDSATIHRVRVAFKKFRYMVEVLAPLLGWVTGKRLKAMNTFQGSMGDIQDAEVILLSLQAFARQLGRQGRATVARAQEELCRRRTALIEGFLDSSRALYTFWKPAS